MKFQKSISFKVLLALILINIIIMAGLGLYTYSVERDKSINALKKSAQKISERISHSMIHPLWNVLTEEVSKIIDYEMADQNITGVIVLDANHEYYTGKVRKAGKEDIQKYGSENEKEIRNIMEKAFIGIKAPIVRENKNIGYVETYITNYYVKKALSAVIGRIAIQTFILSIVSMGAIFLLLRKIILHPVIHLNEVVGRFANKEFEVRAEVKNNDELGDLSNSFNKMADIIQDFTRNLENMVKDRTVQLKEANKDLKKAFKKVTKLKSQQDGDYFLTSQIVNPLHINHVESENINVDFHLSQKKKFSFRDWDAELGGDICIAHTILLQSEMNPNENKEYTVFVNGDAMGKSIQGAGGSLVLGVVFNAYVTRTKFVPGASKCSPEEWLIRCFRELQDVFVSFDGSMLISVVLGIIDDKTGMMYYFNCEHPWTVVYRNGKAQFIEEDLLNRKIGTTINMNKVRIQSFQLQPQDVVFTGSDGRDDILIGYDEETGFRIINEDETLFLKHVEEAKGDTKKIVSRIKKTGELTDDLSLIRIGFKESQYEEKHIPEEFYKFKMEGVLAYKDLKHNKAIKHLQKALKIYDDPELYNYLISACIKTGKSEMALAVAEKAVAIYPGDLKLIMKASILYKKTGEYEKAIYYGKRFHIYNPDNLKNLINLSDAYRYLKDYKLSTIYLNQAEQIDPEDSNVVKLKKIINSNEE